MNWLTNFIVSPVAGALWKGVQYTAPLVIKAIQEQSAPKPVTQEDVQRATAEMAMPDFDIPTDEEPENAQAT